MTNRVLPTYSKRTAAVRTLFAVVPCAVSWLRAFPQQLIGDLLSHLAPPGSLRDIVAAMACAYPQAIWRLRTTPAITEAFRANCSQSTGQMEGQPTGSDSRSSRAAHPKNQNQPAHAIAREFFRGRPQHSGDE